MELSIFTKTYKQSLIYLTLIISAFVLIRLYGDFEKYPYIFLIGIPLLIVEVSGVVSLIKLIRNRHKEKDYRYVIAFVINGLITLLLVFTIFIFIKTVPRIF
ncbi:hypothetical protein SB49_08380 [Sediminicola sp. YIK13]|nr:hypothetical protein SB49_08380 [Sediminicola sp. YIK13]